MAAGKKMRPTIIALGAGLGLTLSGLANTALADQHSSDLKPVAQAAQMTDHAKEKTNRKKSEDSDKQSTEKNDGKEADGQCGAGKCGAGKCG